MKLKKKMVDPSAHRILVEICAAAEPQVTVGQVIAVLEVTEMAYGDGI